MKIGIIDADLLDKGTKFPNLALMKISSYYKKLGYTVQLLKNYDTLNSYDKIFLSKVFDYTNIPIDKKVMVGFRDEGCVKVTISARILEDGAYYYQFKERPNEGWVHEINIQNEKVL